MPHGPHGEAVDFLSYYPQSEIVVPQWEGDAPPPGIVPNYDRYPAIEARGAMPERIQGYLADITAMDRQLGLVLNELAGLNYVLILCSDHGLHMGHHDAVAKFTLWDDAARSPLIVYYANVTPGLVIPEPVSLLDIAPSFLQKAGIPKPSQMDGESLIRYINKYPMKRPSRGAMTTMNDSVSFRSERYRITRYALTDGSYSYELYDVVADPDATTNLALDPQNNPLRDALLAKLDAKLAKWVD